MKRTKLTEPRDVVVQVRWLSRYFDRPAFTRALMDVSFDVYRGEVLGLLGPAGSGKSTLLKILAGRLLPSQGKANVFGRATNRRATRARVGYLPQDSAGERHLIFSEVVDFLKEVFWLKIGSRKPMFAAAVAPKERTSLLGQVLIRNPELVLLDEPFSDLEPPACKEMLEFIQMFKQDGRTVILSGRSLSNTKDICDRLAVLRRGQVEAIGTLQAFLAAPEGLAYLSDLLPQATAERALGVIRHDLAASAHFSQTKVDIEHANASETAAKGPTTPEGILLPFVKKVESDSTPKAQSEATVNHEMLAALTRNPAVDVSSPTEVSEKRTAEPDP